MHFTCTGLGPRFGPLSKAFKTSGYQFTVLFFSYFIHDFVLEGDPKATNNSNKLKTFIKHFLKNVFGKKYFKHSGHSPVSTLEMLVSELKQETSLSFFLLQSWLSNSFLVSDLSLSSFSFYYVGNRKSTMVPLCLLSSATLTKAST